MRKHNSFVWRKQELLQEYKEAIVVPTYKNSDKLIAVFLRHKTFINYASVHFVMQNNFLNLTSICPLNYVGSSVSTS